MYCLVIPFWKKTFDSIWYTYSYNKDLTNLELWQIVEIEFKNEVVYWIVYDFIDKIEFDENKLKNILSIKNNQCFINWYRLYLLKYISEKYFTPIHNSLSLFLPKDLINKVINNKLKYSEKKYIYSNTKKFNLNTSQENIYNKIKNSEYNKFLLYWVTWSWKTHIYIKLILDSLLKWEQSLLLIPEIILWNQIFKKIKDFFWDDVLLINSTITQTKKTKYFLDIYNWNAKIIIWTRSSIFYPYKNLWLIIMDEEHDNSYISDQSPRYKSIDILNKITDLNKNKLVLWSWTPSIESMYKWLKWDYEVLNLLDKYEK